MQIDSKSFKGLCTLFEMLLDENVKDFVDTLFADLALNHGYFSLDVQDIFEFPLTRT
jgi:hypothetical protein